MKTYHTPQATSHELHVTNVNHFPYSPKSSSRAGFTLLFAMLVGSLLLAIGLSIFSIVFRELGLASITRDSSTALFAADTGAECALYWEFKNSFDPDSSAAVPMNCSDQPVSAVVVNQTVSTTTWAFTLPVGEVSAGKESCAEVSIEKNRISFRTIINSSGRNEGGDTATCTPGTRTVERTLEYNF
jgi:Tfp pilus assembly protein PilX